MTLQQRGQTGYRPPRGREMAICYAVSKDGITWEKPELGLVEFEGSQQNNILWREPHGAGVFKDYHEPIGPNQPAIITTSEISVAGQALRITADVAPGGSVKVSMVDRNGKPISSAKPVTETVTDGELQWSQKMSSGPMRLRFEISGAKLYSFSFATAASASVTPTASSSNTPTPTSRGSSSRD